MILNLVCRSRDLRESALLPLKSSFGQVLGVKVPDDVNETVYCLPSSRPHALGARTTDFLASCESLSASLKALQNALEAQQRTVNASTRDTLQLASKLEKLKIL